MAINPLQSMLPKDPEGKGLGNELKARVDMNKAASDALKPTGAPVAEPARPLSNEPQDKAKSQGPYGSGAGEKRINVSDWTKPLGGAPASPAAGAPKMHTGGTVPKTGQYTLKAGEKVLTPEQHGNLKHAMGLAHEALSHEPEKDITPPKDIHEMHVRKADNGGFIVKHIHKHFEHPPEEHVHSDMDSLHDHLEQHWGEPNDGEAESEGQKDTSPGVTAIQKAVGLEK